MNLRAKAKALLEDNPSLSKGDIFYLLDIPYERESSLSISYGIWAYNHSSGRKGGYSMELSI